MYKIFKYSFLVLLIAYSHVIFAQNVHDFKVLDIGGNEFDLKQFKGKKLMIVNTASKCGLTPQFQELEKLYEQYKDSNFIIIGFPTNDFLSQDPGTNQEIKEFCVKNYGVSFPMMSKIIVKGTDMHPLYRYLTTKELNKLEDNKVKWNFQKYLIDENGNFVKVIDPRTSPFDNEIIQWLSNKR